MQKFKMIPALLLAASFAHAVRTKISVAIKEIWNPSQVTPKSVIWNQKQLVFDPMPIITPYIITSIF